MAEEDLRAKVKQLATASIDSSQPYGWFETMYREAEKDASKVPWAKLKPHPELANWLASEAAISDDKFALVIGCGLGDDAEALQASGYQVTAFDISPTAIAWCRERFPNSQVDYRVEDLFNLPDNWTSTFDFVYECRNIQALPVDAKFESGQALRSRAISTVASLVKIGGKVLLITRIRPDESFSEGPPWGLSPHELAEFEREGLETVSERSFLDSRDIPHAIKAFVKS